MWKLDSRHLGVSLSVGPERVIAVLAWPSLMSQTSCFHVSTSLSRSFGKERSIASAKAPRPRLTMARTVLAQLVASVWWCPVCLRPGEPHHRRGRGQGRVRHLVTCRVLRRRAVGPVSSSGCRKWGGSPHPRCSRTQPEDLESHRLCVARFGTSVGFGVGRRGLYQGFPFVLFIAEGGGFAVVDPGARSRPAGKVHAHGGSALRPRLGVGR